MGNLYFLIGLPRSGKSTIAKKWQNGNINIVNHNIEYNNVSCNYNPRIIVNADSIRLALHGQAYIQEAEEMIHTVKNLIIKTYLLMNYDILVDGTHTSQWSIEQLLKIRSDAEYLLIDTPVEVCKQRAIDTNKEYLLIPIERMAAQLSLLKDTYLNETKSS